MTVKRSLNELETAGLIMRVRQGVGEPNRIYVLIPGKEERFPCLIPQSWKSSTESWKRVKRNLRKAINDEKALQHRLSSLSKRTEHRLCTRGGMLESFLQEPERLTDDDVMLLKLVFHRQDTQELLKKLLEREKPETP